MSTRRPCGRCSAGSGGSRRNRKSPNCRSDPSWVRTQNCPLFVARLRMRTVLGHRLLRTQNCPLFPPRRRSQYLRRWIPTQPIAFSIACSRIWVSSMTQPRSSVLARAFQARVSSWPCRPSYRAACFSAHERLTGVSALPSTGCRRPSWPSSSWRYFGSSARRTSRSIPPMTSAGSWVSIAPRR